MQEIAAAAFGFFSEYGIFRLLFIAGAIIVGLAFFLGAVEDLGEGIREMLFWRWLKKDDNFARYSTFSDARRAMIREREEKEYRRATKRLRRRMERRAGIRPEPLWKRLWTGFDRLCDSMAEGLDRLAERTARIVDFMRRRKKED